MSLLLLIIYLAFISLGLPDSLLGSAWPLIYTDIAVPLSYSGIIFMIISAGTVISSLNSDRLNRRFSTGLVTGVSVALTMLALFGFSFADSFADLCFWAIPYGLGAGSIDAALNNYVALHYASRHMSWLHCLWGVGASLGPYIMSRALRASNGNWHLGYRIIGFIQLALTIILFLSLPLWKKNEDEQQPMTRALSLGKTISLRGVKQIMLSFFCYCGLEQTAGLWAATWLVQTKGIEASLAASYASLYFLGITIGRAISGFITYKLNDAQMIRLGSGIIAAGILLLLQPYASFLSLWGMIIIGLGSAPIYPSMIHSTPELFGKEKSQSIIGLQMAAAYMGNIILPPLFGFLAQYTGIGLFPFYLCLLLVLMAVFHESLRRVYDSVK